MKIDYDHTQSVHTVESPANAIRMLFSDSLPDSVLDVGCGPGTWLRAFLNAGTREVFGVDGVELPSGELLFPAANFFSHDLTQPLDLGRKFDLVVCLETAEHLSAEFASVLIESLVRHSHVVLFGAACPRQSGQHHVNCQWPAYWQKLFNACGYVCDDSARWKIWDEPKIDPWYRQDIFIARASPEAGREPRLHACYHPDMFPEYIEFDEILARVVRGGMPFSWYVQKSLRAYGYKVRRALRRVKVGRSLFHDGTQSDRLD